MNRLFLMALAAGMMVSCSDEPTAPETGVRPSQGETGYIALSINMPQTSGSGTRANDSFNDGIPAEYHANDATLILFTGDSEDSESEATVKGVYDMGKLVPQEAEDGNITVKYNTVQQITNPASETEKLYAMVVLNNSGLITVSGTDGANFQLNNKDMVGLKFTDFTAATADYLLTDTNLGAIANVSGSNFLMSNAPLANKQGGTTNPSSAVINTLVEVDKDNIYPSETAAKNGEATEITVERAVAKVTVKSTASSEPVQDTEITGFTINGWTLCNTNKKSYFTRNVDCGTPSWWGYQAYSSSDHRFIGSDEVYKTDDDPAVSYYRTYWAKDPNYESYVQADFNVVKGIPASLNNLGTDAYCLENTFNVANQNQNQTTGVIVKATLTVNDAESDKSFFTLNGDRSTIYTFAIMLEKTKEFYLKNADVKAACEDALTGLLSGQLDASDLVVELTNSDGTTKVTLDGTDDAISDFTKAGNYTLTSIYVKDASASKFKSGVVPDKLKSTNTALIETIKNNVGTVSYYKNGEAYYYVLIRHFDETQTPWKADELTAAGLSDSYPDIYQSKTAEENWLGRYGVVRNNWYQVNVTGIAQIGDAEAPVIPGKPDDTREQWIKAEINVLSWAVRTQDAVLGGKW